MRRLHAVGSFCVRKAAYYVGVIVNHGGNIYIGIVGGDCFNRLVLCGQFYFNAVNRNRSFGKGVCTVIFFGSDKRCFQFDLAKRQRHFNNYFAIDFLQAHAFKYCCGVNVQ